MPSEGVVARSQRHSGNSRGEELDVLIVGAGPTGLVLAGLLQTMGVPVRLIDRQADRVHESRALAMQPRTLEVLRGLGISQRLVEQGNPTVRLELRARRRRAQIPLFDMGTEDTAYPFLLLLSQAETERVLNERLADGGVRVERRVELVALDARSERVDCTLRYEDGSTERVRARYVVGCDGDRSTVRHQARIPFVGSAYPQTFALGDVEADGDLDPGFAYAYVGREGILLFFPLGTPTTWRVIGRFPGSDRNGRAGNGSGTLSLAELQRLVDSFTDGSVRLRDPAWLTTFGLQHRQAARYRAGPVFLAGDAAHVHSPAGAQGMNTGIQDAWNLGWKLALVSSGAADPALLDTYHAERWPVGRSVLRFSDRAFAAGTSTAPVARLLREQVATRVLPFIGRFARGRAFAFRTIAELGINYRRSPAVTEGQPTMRRGPKAGERLPDARVTRNGVPGWLQEFLAEPRFHLLLCGPVAVWRDARMSALKKRYGQIVGVDVLTREAGEEVLCDVNGEAFRRLGIEVPAHYLVRPDGYVGYRGGTDTRALQSYLRKWLPAD